MAEAVLGPAILAVLTVIDAPAQQRRLTVVIAQEERVALGGNRQAP